MFLGNYFNFAMTIVVLALIAGSIAHAQGTTTHYVYDDNGRLKAVIAPNGEANIYEYDPAGNITAIRRNASNILELLDFYPRTGTPGTTVTIVGTGFGGGVSSVAFNGTAAQIVSVSSPQLVVTVPAEATTGPITVTTPGGSATTSLPFTIKGMFVMPETATIASLQSLQFTANLILPDEPDQSLIWSVDGIEGGNSVVGTVSATGFYIAPMLAQSIPTSLFRIRATSVADPLTFGEAVVTVKNTEFIRYLAAPAVSVNRTSPITAVSTISPTVAVNYTNPVTPSPVTTTVAVAYVSPTTVTTPVSGAVAVFRGQPAILITSSMNSPTVSITTGPAISAITPAQISRGATVTLTITGANLGGTSSLTFVNTDNNIDTNIVTTGITVNAGGTSLTAIVTVNGNVLLGRQLVIVTTPAGQSLMVDAGVNAIEIVQ